jgi:hypothetical protein
MNEVDKCWENKEGVLFFIVNQFWLAKMVEKVAFFYQD